MTEAQLAPLRYEPYFDLAGRPHVIADGQPRKSTVLTLSHWPSSPTPDELRADLSAEIVLRYLASPPHHVGDDVEIASNNHFDVDGFLSVWALTHPTDALADPALVAEVARAGDFGWTDDRRAARIAFALAVLRDPARSTLPAETFDEREPYLVANLHRELLDRFGDLAEGIDEHEDLWSADEQQLEDALEARRAGRIEITEVPDVDLAVVHVDPSVPGGIYRYCLQYQGPCHPMAVHRATACSRVLYLKGNHAALVYRFESWVRYQSRRVPGRIDLTPLAEQLSAAETQGARWTWAWPNSPNPPVPWLQTADFAPTSIAVDRLCDDVVEFLATQPVAFDPHAPIPAGSATYS